MSGLEKAINIKKRIDTNADLDGFLVDTKLIADEFGNFAALITLQLDNFAEIFILYDGTIGCLK